MKNIPLWGKITGGCALIFVFLLIVGGGVSESWRLSQAPPTQ